MLRRVKKRKDVIVGSEAFVPSMDCLGVEITEESGKQDGKGGGLRALQSWDSNLQVSMEKGKWKWVRQLGLLVQETCGGG
jgi:hypothetical protein